jgi:hypothetical protein
MSVLKSFKRSPIQGAPGKFRCQHAIIYESRTHQSCFESNSKSGNPGKHAVAARATTFVWASAASRSSSWDASIGYRPYRDHQPEADVPFDSRREWKRRVDASAEIPRHYRPGDKGSIAVPNFISAVPLPPADFGESTPVRKSQGLQRFGIGMN